MQAVCAHTLSSLQRSRSPVAGICSRGCCHDSRISVDPQTQLPDYNLHFLFQEIFHFFSFLSDQIHKDQQKARKKFPGFRPYKTECVGFVGQFKDITTKCLTPVTRLYQLRSWPKTRQVKQPTGVTAHSLLVGCLSEQRTGNGDPFFSPLTGG